MANKINTAIDDQRLRAQEAALRRTDMLSRANAIAANQEALASQLNSSSSSFSSPSLTGASLGGFSSSPSLTREGRGGLFSHDFFADENDDFASDWGNAAANDPDLSGFTNDPFGTTTTTPTAQIHPQNQGAQARARVSSTVAMQNALDKRISDNANHIFAQSTSQQASNPHPRSDESTGSMIYHGIDHAFHDPNTKFWQDLAAFNHDMFEVDKQVLLAMPVGEAVEGAFAIGSKVADGLGSLASRASMFREAATAEGVPIDAADLGGEASSGSRMNTSSNMYREGEGEFGGRKAPSWKTPDEASDDMNEAQRENLNRFLDKIPRNSTNVRVRDFLNGGKVFQADSPASTISGSFARYEKQIDEFGETVLYTKTIYGPDNEIIHIAQKFPPAGKFYPEESIANDLGFNRSGL